MNIREIVKSEGPICLLFTGDDHFAIKNTIRAIKKEVLATGNESFNYDLFFAGDAEFSQVMTALNSLPVFDSRRMVVLYNIENLDEAPADLLLEYLSNPMKEICMIMTAGKIKRSKTKVKEPSGKKAKKDKKDIVKEAGKIHGVMEIPLSVPGSWNHGLETYLKDESRKEGISFAGNTAETMASLYTEESKYEAVMDLKKIKYFLGKNSDKADIRVLQQVLDRFSQHQIYQITRNIFKGDRKEAYSDLSALSTGTPSDLMILSAMINYVRKVGLLYMHWVENGSSFQQSLNASGLKGQDEYLSKMKNTLAERLAEVTGLLSEADYKIKRGKGEIRVILFDLLNRACIRR